MLKFKYVVLLVVFLGLSWGVSSCLISDAYAYTLSAKYLFEIKIDDEAQHGTLNQPAGLASDKDGNIYVVDTVNNRVVVFKKSGQLSFTFGKNDEGEQLLKAPMALAVDPNAEKVYVADSSNYRVQVFDKLGKFISTIDLNKDIEEKEKKVRPIGIAVNKEGNIYISDADNNFIRAYSPDGKMILKFGGFGDEDGKFCIPVGLSINSENKLYVVDMNNSRVQVFDAQGKFLLKMGQSGDTKGSFGKPKDLSVDDRGFIYVSDGAHLVVHVFDKQGNFVDVIGADNNIDLQFASPFGVEIVGNQLYVTDRWRNSIRVYEANIK